MFEIFFLPETLESHNNTIGIVYIKHGEYIFPEIDWYDFIVIVCNWWSENSIILKNNDVVDCEYRFMDGPCSFKVQGKGHLLNLLFICNDEVIFRSQLARTELLDAVTLFRQKLLLECKQKKWYSDEIKKLEEWS